jgi:hypothetical protein
LNLTVNEDTMGPEGEPAGHEPRNGARFVRDVHPVRFRPQASFLYSAEPLPISSGKTKGGSTDQRFDKWFALRDLALSQLPGLGECSAVYALRDSSTGDVLKFGHTGCLRTRIVGNYLSGFGGPTTKRIHRELLYNRMISRVEVAWIEAKDATEAELREREFRRHYKKLNGRRPNWDRVD